MDGCFLPGILIESERVCVNKVIFFCSKIISMGCSTAHFICVCVCVINIVEDWFNWWLIDEFIYANRYIVFFFSLKFIFDYSFNLALSYLRIENLHSRWFISVTHYVVCLFSYYWFTKSTFSMLLSIEINFKASFH